MFTRKIVLASLSTVAIVLGVIGVAGAAAPKSSVASREHHSSAKTSVLGTRFAPTKKQARQLRRISRLVKAAPKASIAATADVSSSRPVALPTGRGDAWITPASDGSVCTFISDPLGGYGSSCASQADLLAGGAITVVGGSPTAPNPGELVAVIVIPDGGAAPTVQSPSGETDALMVSSNTASTVVASGSQIVAGKVVLTLPKVSVPKCDSPQPGESFRRCAL